LHGKIAALIFAEAVRQWLWKMKYKCHGLGKQLCLYFTGSVVLPLGVDDNIVEYDFVILTTYFKLNMIG